MNSNSLCLHLVRVLSQPPQLVPRYDNTGAIEGVSIMNLASNDLILKFGHEAVFW